MESEWDKPPFGGLWRRRLDMVGQQDLFIDRGVAGIDGWVWWNPDAMRWEPLNVETLEEAKALAVVLWRMR